MPIDDSLAFKPVRIALLTISDSRSAAEDRSGDKLEELLTDAGHMLAARAIIKDETDLIVSRLHNWIDDPDVDVVITTGGTGLTGRDVTPEALHRLGTGHPGVRRAVPLAQLPDDRHLDDPVARLRRRRARHLYLRVARLDRRGDRRLGRHTFDSTRQPAQALQFRRVDAAVDGIGGFVLYLFSSARYPSPVESTKPLPPISGRGAPTNHRPTRTGSAERVADGDWLDTAEAIDGAPPLRTIVTVEHPKTIISRNKSPDIGFDRSINPYRGCEHGCIYCFARPTHAFHDLSPGLDFESRLFAKPDAAKLLRAELAKRNYTAAPIAIGTNTDPLPTDRA